MSKRIPAYEGPMPYIFTSYAHADSQLVLPVIECLFSGKYRVWYDEGIAPGSEWPKNIEDHLRNAAAVLVFVSENSLKSPNCENEVVNALAGKASVYQFKLNGETHPLLNDCTSVEKYESLPNLLDKELIGDGVSGYETGIGKIKKGNFWTAIIAVAVILVLALCVGIYFLNAGFFDDLLPGLSTEKMQEEAYSEIVETDSNVLVHGIMQQTHEDLTRLIDFESEETRDILYNAVNFYAWHQKTDMTYENLTTCFLTDLWLDNANNEVLKYMQYFPSLKKLYIRNGDNLNLELLLLCAKLETVYLSESVFPLEIPDGASFTVEYYK